MTITIRPEITSPARVVLEGTLDLRTAIDVVDVIELLAPEAVDLELSAAGQVLADGLEHLSRGVDRARRRGQQVVALDAPPLLDLLLTIAGVNEIDR